MDMSTTITTRPRGPSWWKMVSQNLDEGNIPRFLQHCKFLPKLQFWLLLVDFLKILSPHVVPTKIFVWPSQIFYLFSLTFQHHKKVKEQNLKKHFFEMFDFMSWFVTRGQNEGGNHDRWLSQQRTNKFEYVFCCLWTNHELKK